MRALRSAAAVAAAAALTTVVFRALAPASDVLIRNGRVIDGTGSPWYRDDVALRLNTRP